MERFQDKGEGRHKPTPYPNVKDIFQTKRMQVGDRLTFLRLLSLLDFLREGEKLISWNPCRRTLFSYGDKIQDDDRQEQNDKLASSRDF